MHTPTEPVDPPVLLWASDRCLRVGLGAGLGDEVALRVRAAWRALRTAALPGLRSATAAYASLLLAFDLATLDAAEAEAAVRRALAAAAAPGADAPRTLEVPVCYDEDLAPDLAEVARLHGLSAEEVVALHAGASYAVRFLGFSPGFPYLAGLPEALATPRLARPRTRVEAGSVAIAGRQAGVYPQATPGGWRVLGRTPLRLFDPTRDPPALLAIGDRVRFVPIDRTRFEALSAPSR